MRIGIAKPDYGIRGGFEIILDRVAAELVTRGHDVTWLTVEAARLPPQPYGVDVPAEVWSTAPEFFRYAALMEAFALLNVETVDVVLTTQPPSFAVRHERKLSLFFHHHRLYYDLADVYERAGFVESSAVHAAATELVRELDDGPIDEVGWFLAGSHHVAERLDRFNAAGGRTSVCHVGLRFPVADRTVPRPGGQVLCVSRHEFPKRTELFVHAMKSLPEQRGLLVGRGGRLGWSMALDRWLDGEVDVPNAESLWMCSDLEALPPGPSPNTNIAYETDMSDADLAAAYRSASVVVAPAYLEDYGLTALEAMAHGKPVIVCGDGGGLTELVQDGVTGRVVQPDGASIARAVRDLVGSPPLLAEMGEAARRFAAEFTWERTMEEFEVGLRQVAP